MTLFGLPVMNLVLIEVGFAIGVILVAGLQNMASLIVAIAIVAVAVLFAILRWRGQWFTQWLALELRYFMRSHDTPRPPVARAGLEDLKEGDEDAVIGDDDPRVNVLRAAIPKLVVAHGSDHDRQPVGLAWDDGSWTAVLLVEPTPELISSASNSAPLPLSVLGPCLEDRGVVLDSIQVIWHTYPGSAALPADSPALNSYLEVLGPLPAAARRTTWVAVRLDPRRCPAAIRERGGGVVGAHRALIGALSRVRNALDSREIPTRPLDPDELLRAGVTACELNAAVAAGGGVKLQERKNRVIAAGVRHTSYAITRWPKGKVSTTLNSLTSVRALSATVAMSISPSTDDGQVGLRGVVRVSARNEQELDAADKRLNSVAERAGVALTPLRGLQVAGLAATLPLGGTA
ncbi:MAG: type VII secretion protein EccE [Actinophytocola sp.]|nr:type VII secretion protein EccE [Actinophytocola sp.]